MIANVDQRLAAEHRLRDAKAAFTRAAQAALAGLPLAAAQTAAALEALEKARAELRALAVGATP